MTIYGHGDFQTLTAITRCPPPSDGHWTIVLGEDHAGAEGNSALATHWTSRLQLHAGRRSAAQYE
jgi:hypothetical protein